MNINAFIPNASGSLDDKLDLINICFNRAVKAVVEKLNAKDIDIIFLNAADNVIKELGVGGYTVSTNLIYISLAADFDIDQTSLTSCILHEVHHAIRWRRPGFGKTLTEVLVTEGLATLFEEEATGKTPIYAKVKYSKESIELAKKEFDNPKFNYYDWFVGGNKEKDIPRWFGYTYGYILAKNLSQKSSKKSSELVNQSIAFEFRAPDDVELALI